MKARTTLLAIVCLIFSWYYATSYWAESGRGFPVEYYPFWNASRAILHGADPYGQTTTVQNQVAAYGNAVGGAENEQRFAYPAYATIPLLPLGYLSFPVANYVVFVIMATLTILSVGWLRRRWNWTTALYAAFTLCGFPIIYDLCSRQPTLLFYGFAAASLALASSGRLISAGVCAALSVGKPHLALSVTLAEAVWCLGDWRHRRLFLASFAGSALVLFAVSCFLSPGWTSSWVTTLRAYTHYNKPSLVVSLLGGSAGLIVSAVLLVILVISLFNNRRRDLLLLAAGAIAVIHLLIPYANYNAVILLIPIVWIFDNSAVIGSAGEMNRFMLAAVRMVLVLFFSANLLGAVLLHTSGASRFVAWVLPSVVTHALVLCVFAAMATHFATLLRLHRIHMVITSASCLSE